MSKLKNNRITGLSLGDIKDDFEWPVIIEIPQGVDDKGKEWFKEHKITGKFNVLSQEKFDELSQYAEEQSDFSYIYDQVVSGWRGVYSDDEKQVPLEFNPENKDSLKQKMYIMNAFVNAYFRSQGGKKAQRKN